MQYLGKFKGCAYAKFDCDPYKTYWVYLSNNQFTELVRYLSTSFITFVFTGPARG